MDERAAPVASAPAALSPADWQLHKNGFTLKQPVLYRPWINYLENGQYGLKISHLGDAVSSTLQEPRVAVTNYDFWEPNMGRFLYVQDEVGHWSPSFLPAEVELDSYSCTHRPGATEFCSSLRQIEVTSTHFLPLAVTSSDATSGGSTEAGVASTINPETRKGTPKPANQPPAQSATFELWRIGVTNRGSTRRQVLLYTLAEMLLYPNHGVDPTYFSWFTNSQYVERRSTMGGTSTLEYTRTNDDNVFGFITAIGTPVGYEASYRDFCGNGTLRNPAALQNRGLKNSHSGGDRMAGSFHFLVNLEPGDSVSFGISIGVGREAYNHFSDRFSTLQAIDAEYNRVVEYWTNRLAHPQLATLCDVGTEVCSPSSHENANGAGGTAGTASGTALTASGTADQSQPTQFASYLQTFFPYQVIQQGLGMVRNPFRGFRDVAQDIMGLCHFDMNGAKQLIRDLPIRMFENGRALRQWNTSGGYQDERDFHDLGPWLILAVDRYLTMGGDTSILYEEFGYFRSDKRESLLTHMVRAIQYTLHFGAHNLLEIGEGDWNDALSGLGHKGESLWLSQFVYYALGLLHTIAQKEQVKLPLDVEATRERLYQGVLEGWTGEWFLRGYTESGHVVGGEERIFLLPQAWFTISGMAERNPKLAQRALESMVAKLRSDYGLLLCFPAFDAPDPNVGNLSALAPGQAENFAVYNHGSMFGVYSLFQAGMVDEAIEFFLKVLPMTKDIRNSHAEPYVLVNFYNGGYYPEKAGRGGIPWLTGTVAWLGMALFDYILPQGLYQRIAKKVEEACLQRLIEA